jgi:hypothetical protein
MLPLGSDARALQGLAPLVVLCLLTNELLSRSGAESWKRFFPLYHEVSLLYWNKLCIFQMLPIEEPDSGQNCAEYVGFSSGIRAGEIQD